MKPENITFIIAVIGCLLGLVNACWNIGWAIWQRFDQYKESLQIGTAINADYEHKTVTITVNIINVGKTPLAISSIGLVAQYSQGAFSRMLTLNPLEHLGESIPPSGMQEYKTDLIAFEDFFHIYNESNGCLVAQTMTSRGRQFRSDNILPLVIFTIVYRDIASQAQPSKNKELGESYCAETKSTRGPMTVTANMDANTMKKIHMILGKQKKA